MIDVSTEEMMILNKLADPVHEWIKKHTDSDCSYTVTIGLYCIDIKEAPPKVDK